MSARENKQKKIQKILNYTADKLMIMVLFSSLLDTSKHLREFDIQSYSMTDFMTLYKKY